MSTTETITLDEPIKRGETTITRIELRKPNAGALRGCSLRALLDFETDAIIKVLPRISEPPLLEGECNRMDPADLVKAGAVIAGFLLSKEVKAAAAEQVYLPMSTTQ